VLNIYLTRHGETQWNKENRLQGWEDSALTEKGIKNAIALGERLVHTNLHAIYSSPSGRAFQTAKLICLNRTIPILLDEDLKEISFGEWEGKIQQEIEEKYPKEFYNFWNAPHQYNHVPHNGEGVGELKQRVERAMKKIITAHSNGNVMIVTHAVVIRAIMSYFMDIPIEKWWDPPFIHGTSLTVIKIDGNTFRVELLGDTSHIE
jgi:broad specificity phosphatase PhoE